jgi:hypothetical protein
MPGCGKSYSWLQIAAAYPKSKFYCIDTDSSIERLLTTEFPQLRDVNVFEAQDWLTCTKALDLIKSKITPNGWLIVDSIDNCWSMVQNYFISELFRKDAGDYFLQMRKEMKAGSTSLSVLKGWTDWVTINRMYEDFINVICYQLPVNIFLTAKSEKVAAEDDSSVQDMFSQFGQKPAGEKKNIYRVHSVLLLSHNRQGFSLSSIKDRGRARLENVPLTENMSFAVRYLQVVAGWEPEQ